MLVSAGLLLALLAGAALGLAAAAALLVFAFFHLTRPAPLRDPSPHTASLAHAGSSASPRGAGRDVTAPGATMPHAIARGGAFSGTVYTVPLSMWERDAVIIDWPPASPGFQLWKATLSQGTLVLAPLPTPAAAPAAKGKAAAGAAGEEQGAERLPARKGILLEGCTVELVVDGLLGRSEMVRRAPLLVTHPRHPLLDGEPGFYLFSTDPCSKQQWLHALSYWCSGGERLRGIEPLYAAFCRAMAQTSLLPYATESSPPAAPSTQQRPGAVTVTASPSARGSDAPAAGRDGGKRGGGWRRWGSARVQELQHRVHSSRRKPGTGAAGADGSQSGAAGPSAPASPAKSAFAAAGGTVAAEREASAQGAAPAAQLPDLDSIIEQRWMQSRKIPVPPVPPASSRTGSAPPSPAKLPVLALPAVDGTAHRSGSGAATPLQGSSPTKAASTSALPSLASAERNGSAASSSSGMQAAASTSGAARAASSAPPGQLPALPPLLPPDHFVNMTVTRACFDLLRNPAFQEHLRARIQRQLSRLHPPDFVQSLEVVGLDVGRTAPSVANFAALPAPDAAAAWPQLAFDMRYSGDFTVTIECKVDIRDAPAWSTLDKALNKIEGRRGGAEPAAGAGLDGVDAVLVEGDAEQEGSEGDGGDTPRSDSDASGSSPTAGRAGEGGGEHPRRRFMGQLRQHAAQRLRQLADHTATQISRMPLRVSLTFSLLEGRMCVWVPPPPGDRLFWSFLAPPRLELRARPQIGGRLLKYAYHASRASAWIQSRMELSFKKNIVFPGGGDFVLPLLMAVDNPRAADGLPGAEAPQRGGKARAQAQARAAGGRSSAPSSPQKQAAGRAQAQRGEAGSGAAIAAGGSGAAQASGAELPPLPPVLQEADREEGDEQTASGIPRPAPQHAPPAYSAGDGSTAQPFVQLQLRRRLPGAGVEDVADGAIAAVFSA